VFNQGGLSIDCRNGYLRKNVELHSVKLECLAKAGTLDLCVFL
jgi:hypothetical protein